MSFITSILTIILAVTILLSAQLYFMQDGMIFLGAKLSSQTLAELRSRFADSELRLTSVDGTKLHGWYLQAKGNQPAPLLIYFGGNAEDITHMLFEQHHFPGYSLLLISYRGYGLSAGKPSQKTLCSDALFLYDHFTASPEIDGKRILLMGRSLGTGVAVHLAAKRAVERLILISPFDSMLALGKEIYPWLPVSLLLRHPFNSKALAPAIKAPMLAIIASNDSIIAPRHSQALIEAWGGETKLMEIAGIDHNQLGDQRQFWRAIEAFIEGPIYLDNHGHDVKHPQ